MPSPLLIPGSEYDAHRLLEAWEWLAPPQNVLAVSEFGHLFTLSAEQQVSCLDVLSGTIAQVAWCQEEFTASLQDPDFQAEWLLSALGSAARAHGLVRGPGQCFAFLTPPTLGGALDATNLTPWDLHAYHLGLSQLFRQLRGLPYGSHVIIKPRTGKA